MSSYLIAHLSVSNLVFIFVLEDQHFESPRSFEDSLIILFIYYYFMFMFSILLKLISFEGMDFRSSRLFSTDH